MKTRNSFVSGLLALLALLLVSPMSQAKNKKTQYSEIDGGLNTIKDENGGAMPIEEEIEATYTEKAAFAGVSTALVGVMSSTGGAAIPAGFPESGTAGWWAGVLLFGLTAPIPALAFLQRKRKQAWFGNRYRQAWEKLGWVRS